MRQQLATLQNISPLPLRAEPQPWEDLASVISRTARKMEYPHPKWILQPEISTHHIELEALPLLSTSEDYQLLAKLLELDKRTLIALTLHRFTPRLEKPVASEYSANQLADLQLEHSPLMSHLSLFSHYNHATRVCPYCLDEADGYDRLYWRVTPILFCPRHRVFLRGACPVCSAPIPALRPNLRSCPSCKSGDYRSSARLVPEDASWLFMSHRLLFDHLGIEHAEQGEPFQSDELSLLQQFSSPEYFQLVAKLSFLLVSGSPRVDLLPFLSQVLNIETLIPQLAGSTEFLLLHYTLAHWPIHFWVVLEHFQRALREESSHFDDARRFVEPWNDLLDRGDYWCEETYREQTLTLLDSLVDVVAIYFRHYRRRVWHKVYPFGGKSSPEGILLADRLRSPTSDERVIPYPWEDVASVIRRVSGKMGYDHPAWMLITTDTTRQKIFAPDLPIVHRRTDYIALERQLGLDEERLYRLTLHQWSKVLQPHDSGERTSGSHAVTNTISRDYFSRAQAEFFCIPLEQTKVCPACLDEEDAYDRLFWRLRTMILCPDHALVLADCCPHCFAFIPALRPSPTTCPSCGIGDYRLSKCPHISSTSWLYSGQLLLLSFLLGEAELNRDYWRSFANSPLLRVQPWQYFRLLDAFHLLLLMLPINSVMLHALSSFMNLEELAMIASPTIQTAVHTAFFHYLFADWPKHLLMVLEHFSSLLKGNEIGRELFKSYWESDALIQRFFPPNQESESCDPYQHLTQVLEMLAFWGTALEFPGKAAPLPPSYLSARREQRWDLEECDDRGISHQFYSLLRR